MYSHAFPSSPTWKTGHLHINTRGAVFSLSIYELEQMCMTRRWFAYYPHRPLSESMPMVDVKFSIFWFCKEFAVCCWCINMWKGFNIFRGISKMYMSREAAPFDDMAKHSLPCLTLFDCQHISWLVLSQLEESTGEKKRLRFLSLDCTFIKSL